MAQDMSPMRGSAGGASGLADGHTLSGAQKAAVIVRLLLAEGEKLPLAQLPDELQTELTTQIAEMRLIDRSTLNAVAAEFIETLDQVGLTMNDGLRGALALMGEQLGDKAASQLRSLVAATDSATPWPRVQAADDDQLLALLRAERPQIGAVMLSKLPTARAASLLAELPGEQARELALAVAHTDGIAPETVHRIGCALARQVEARPPRAFPLTPPRRVGQILDATPAHTRNAVLEGIEAEDESFARAVRRELFTWADIPRRIDPLDVPRVIRMADQDRLATVLSATLATPDTEEGAASAFLLENAPQRLADTLRDEAGTRRPPDETALEAAMSAVIASIRTMAEAGEITLLTPP